MTRCSLTSITAEIARSPPVVRSTRPSPRSPVSVRRFSLQMGRGSRVSPYGLLAAMAERLRSATRDRAARHQESRDSAKVSPLSTDHQRRTNFMRTAVGAGIRRLVHEDGTTSQCMTATWPMCRARCRHNPSDAILNVAPSTSATSSDDDTLSSPSSAGAVAAPCPPTSVKPSASA